MIHLPLQSLSFWRLKMGKTPSQHPNQPNYAFYRV
nr:MAG TPA: translation initiation factor-like protein [Caudoviricetes sp.]DAX27046.1 MAG TPA: translation initiation factor-like protein [Caudoviricetes sp.]